MAYERSKWQVDLDTYLGIKTTFILAGNVHDAQFGFDAASGFTYTLSLNQLLFRHLTQDLGYSQVVFYNRVDGFHNKSADSMVDEFLKPVQEDPASKSLCLLQKDERTGKMRQTSFSSAATIMRDALTSEKRPVAIIFDLATTAIEAPNRLTDAEREPMVQLFLASKEAHSCVDPRSGNLLTNTLFIIADKVNDIPPWFYLGNPYVKTLAVGKPTREQREAYIVQRRDAFYNFGELSEVEQRKFVRNLCNLTEGFCCAELKGLLDMCRKGNGTHTDQARRAIDSFRYGLVQNFWDHIDLESIRQARAIMSSRVKGQDYAIDKALSILYRAASGLSLSGSTSSSKPKGVLFLAGPTGTGKTELAKAITQAIFGDESQMIRFDMSEFGERQSDQRLFGAPPGYVGYESGGELTNAVREKPFSLLLFDEIEKANSSILDKFLQILDDGRLTDSHGETVYFGETIIVFTSNLGLSDNDPITGKTEVLIDPDTYDDPEEFHQAVIENIKASGKCRPEFINRIGENFVVFDWIKPDLAEVIARSKLASFGKRLQAERNLTLGMTWGFYEVLMSHVLTNIHNGGRGVMNMLEERFLNPLSKTLLCCEVPSMGECYIESMYVGDDPELEDTFVIKPKTTVAFDGFFLTDEKSRPAPKQEQAAEGPGQATEQAQTTAGQE